MYYIPVNTKQLFTSANRQSTLHITLALYAEYRKTGEFWVINFVNGQKGQNNEQNIENREK